MAGPPSRPQEGAWPVVGLSQALSYRKSGRVSKEEEEGVHGGGYCSDVELWSWAMEGGWDIQAGDQKRALDDRQTGVWVWLGAA